MECNEARDLIHKMMDTGAPMSEALRVHLGSCPDCRNANARLRLAQEAFTVFACETIDEQALGRLSDAVMRSISAAGGPARSWPAWARAMAITCAVAAVFALGLVSGRWLWPLEVVRTELIPVPQERIVERPVRVEVPVPVEVVRQRVVTRRVPVYVSRPETARADSDIRPAPEPGAGGAVPGGALPVFSRPVITSEIHPTTIVDRSHDAAGEAMPTSTSSINAGETVAAAVTSAGTG